MLSLSRCINVVQRASLLYGERPFMQYTLPVAVDLRLHSVCVNVQIEIMCAVCSECSLNLVAGQVFVGACSVGFFSDLYYQGTNVAGYIVFALVCMSF